MIKPLLAALSRLTTAIEQLTPTLTQATREANQGRLRPDENKRGRHEEMSLDRFVSHLNAQAESDFGKPRRYIAQETLDTKDVDRDKIEAMKADLREAYGARAADKARIETTE